MISQMYWLSVFVLCLMFVRLHTKNPLERNIFFGSHFAIMAIVVLMGLNQYWR